MAASWNLLESKKSPNKEALTPSENSLAQPYTTHLRPDAYQAAIEPNKTQPDDTSIQALYAQPICCEYFKETKTESEINKIHRKEFINQFSHLLDLYAVQCEEFSAGDHALDAIMHLNHHFFLEAYTGSQPNFYFSAYKNNLEKLLILFRDNTIPLRQRRSVFTNLCQNFHVCAPGLYEHSENALLSLEKQQTLQYWLAELRTNIIHQFAEQYIHDHEIKPADSIHSLNFILRIAKEKNLAPITTIDKINDPYIKDAERKENQEFLQSFDNLYAEKYSATILDCVLTNFSLQFEALCQSLNITKNPAGWFLYNATLIEKITALTKAFNLDDLEISFFDIHPDNDNMIRLSPYLFKIQFLKWCATKQTIFTVESEPAGKNATFNYLPSDQNHQWFVIDGVTYPLKTLPSEMLPTLSAYLTQIFSLKHSLKKINLASIESINSITGLIKLLQVTPNANRVDLFGHLNAYNKYGYNYCYTSYSLIWKNFQKECPSLLNEFYFSPFFKAVIHDNLDEFQRLLVKEKEYNPFRLYDNRKTILEVAKEFAPTQIYPWLLEIKEYNTRKKCYPNEEYQTQKPPIFSNNPVVRALFNFHSEQIFVKIDQFLRGNISITNLKLKFLCATREEIKAVKKWSDVYQVLQDFSQVIYPQLYLNNQDWALLILIADCIIADYNLLYKLAKLGASFEVPYAQSRLARFHISKNNFKDAMPLLIASKDYHGLGLVYEELKKYQSALNNYKLAIDMDDNSFSMVSFATLEMAINKRDSTRYRAAYQLLFTAAEQGNCNALFAFAKENTITPLGEFSTRYGLSAEYLQICCMDFHLEDKCEQLLKECCIESKSTDSLFHAAYAIFKNQKNPPQFLKNLFNELRQEDENFIHSVLKLDNAEAITNLIEFDFFEKLRMSDAKREIYKYTWLNKPALKLVLSYLPKDDPCLKTAPRKTKNRFNFFKCGINQEVKVSPAPQPKVDRKLT